MKLFIQSKNIAVALLLSLSLFSMRPVSGGALVHASVTGKVWAINLYHGQIVRFTIRDNGWPNALHDIVIKPYTHIFANGKPSEKLSPNVLHKGLAVRAEGGVTTFGNRIVADRVTILSK